MHVYVYVCAHVCAFMCIYMHLLIQVYTVHMCVCMHIPTTRPLQKVELKLKLSNVSTFILNDNALLLMLYSAFNTGEHAGGVDDLYMWTYMWVCGRMCGYVSCVCVLYVYVCKHV